MALDFDTASVTGNVVLFDDWQVGLNTELSVDFTSGDINFQTWTFGPSDVNTSLNRIAKPGGGNFIGQGDVIRFSTDGVLPAPLLADTDYRAESNLNGFIHPADYVTGDAIDLTDGGSGIHTVTVVRSKKILVNDDGFTGDSSSDYPIIITTDGVLPTGFDPSGSFYDKGFGFDLENLVGAFQFSRLPLFEGVEITPATGSGTHTISKATNTIFVWDDQGSYPPGYLPDKPFRQNDKVRLTAGENNTNNPDNGGVGTLPGGLLEATDYYLDVRSPYFIRFLDAFDGNVVEITSRDQSAYYHLLEELESRAITITAHGLSNGDKVQATTTGVLPSPLALLTDYWVGVIDVDTIFLSTTENLQDPIYITVGDGSGTHTLNIQEGEDDMALQTETKIVGKQIDGSLRYQAWQISVSVSNDYLIPLEESLWKCSSKGYLRTNAALNIQLNVDENSPSTSPMDVIAIPANDTFVWEDGISIKNIYIPAGQTATVNIYAE